MCYVVMSLDSLLHMLYFFIDCTIVLCLILCLSVHIHCNSCIHRLSFVVDIQREKIKCNVLKILYMRMRRAICQAVELYNDSKITNTHDYKYECYISKMIIVK